MRERLILRFILLAMAVLAASQLYASTGHATVAGFERMEDPREADAVVCRLKNPRPAGLRF